MTLSNLLSPQPVLLAENLKRDFVTKSGNRHAVNGVTVKINPGEIVALLGPNGAGKTTTVRMCATLLSPTSGRITVAGIDAIKNPKAARKITGLVLGGEGGFYSRATARKNLLFFADIAGVPSRDRQRAVTSALEAVQLTDRADDKVREFSRGMTQRLHIARALLSKPSLLLLDEPTTGLDPEIALEIRRLVRSLAGTGVGILLTSHNMYEVEDLADHIQVIAVGQQIAAGSVADIAKAAGLPPVIRAAEHRPATLEESYLALVANPSVEPVETTGTTGNGGDR